MLVDYRFLGEYGLYLDTVLRVHAQYETHVYRDVKYLIIFFEFVAESQKRGWQTSA